jgi:hypothetical protein
MELEPWSRIAAQAIARLRNSHFSYERGRIIRGRIMPGAATLWLTRKKARDRFLRMPCFAGFAISALRGRSRDFHESAPAIRSRRRGWPAAARSVQADLRAGDRGSVDLE